MRTITLPVLRTLIGLFQSRARLHLEILALRQQLAMVNQTPRKRLRFHWGQRLFWICLYRLWPGCLQTLRVFKPDTLVRWHRKGFRLYWAWKSCCRRVGRPPISPEVRKLIRTMPQDNIGWGAPRIHGELQLLGIHVSQATVAKYMVHHPKPPSQTWRTFLDNHIKDLVSVDFFTVPTATLRILYVFLVLRHDRRAVVHFNVTEHPTAQWTAQQVVEAFPWDPAHRYLLRDRDNIYGAIFRKRVHSLGMRECLDHVLVLNEFHLKRILRAYFSYYHAARTHLALDKQCPEPRSVESPEQGSVFAFPHLGGLHHEYRRAA